MKKKSSKSKKNENRVGEKSEKGKHKGERKKKHKKKQIQLFRGFYKWVKKMLFIGVFRVVVVINHP